MSFGKLDGGDEAAVKTRVGLFDHEREGFLIPPCGDEGGEGAKEKDAENGAANDEEDAAHFEGNLEEKVTQHFKAEEEDGEGEGEGESPEEFLGNEAPAQAAEVSEEGTAGPDGWCGGWGGGGHVRGRSAPGLEK